MTSIASISQLCAPYVDTTAWPPYDLVSTTVASGIKYYTLAFVVSDPITKTASWGGYYNLTTTTPPWFLDKITALRALGGDVIISCGGAAGQELAQTITDIPTLVAQYQVIINTYNISILDFDIEGSAIADSASIDRRNKALVFLKAANPNLKIHYTLPVLPSGLDSNGNALIVNAFKNNLAIDLCNIMAMDYGSAGIEMGQAAITAAQNTYAQMVSAGYKNPKIGLCPMIGLNDVQGETFTLADGQSVLAFANSTSYMGLLTFWSANRDIAEAATMSYSSSTNTGLVQTQNQFGIMFNSFGNGSSSTPIVTPTPVVTPTPTPTPVTTPVTTPTSTSTHIPCTFCTVCSKTTNTACVLRIPIITPTPTTTQTVIVIPTPTPVITPSPTSTPTPTSTSAILQWAVGTSYVVNNLVTYNGQTYVCIAPNTAISSWTPDVTLSLWNLKPVPSTTTPATWTLGATYVAGNVVVYNGVTYTCLAGHTAISSWTPDVTLSLWKKN